MADDSYNGGKEKKPENTIQRGNYLNLQPTLTYGNVHLSAPLLLRICPEI